MFSVLHLSAFHKVLTSASLGLSLYHFATMQMKTKKKALKKEGKPQDIPEDEEAGFKHAVYVQTCKLFADLERLRQRTEQKEMNER